MAACLIDRLIRTLRTPNPNTTHKQIKIRQELASSTYPTWFGMIEKKLDDTGYCANGKLSIADLVVRGRV